MISTQDFDEESLLRSLLAAGLAMERELDQLVRREQQLQEDRRFQQAQLLVTEIESVDPATMEEVVLIMQRNKEALQLEPDGTLEVSYDALSVRSIAEIRQLLAARAKVKQQTDENMVVDVM